MIEKKVFIWASVVAWYDSTLSHYHHFHVPPLAELDMEKEVEAKQGLGSPPARLWFDEWAKNRFSIFLSDEKTEEQRHLPEGLFPSYKFFGVF